MSVAGPTGEHPRRGTSVSQASDVTIPGYERVARPLSRRPDANGLPALEDRPAHGPDGEFSWLHSGTGPGSLLTAGRTAAAPEQRVSGAAGDGSRDGTEDFDSNGNSLALGSSGLVTVGRLDTSGSGNGPLSSGFNTGRAIQRPIYGLSPVLTVEDAADSLVPPTPSSGSVATADGAAIPVVGQQVRHGGENKRVQISLGRQIRLGQVAQLSYTDPTAEDDAMALQDETGNDVESFSGLMLENLSTAAPTVPGRPTGLSATGLSTSQIGLSWDAPSDNGGAAISGYRIEVSLDGETDWSDLQSNTGSTATF